MPVCTSTPVKRHDRQRSGAAHTLPHSEHFPASPDSHHTQPRCHRAFVSPSSNFPGSSPCGPLPSSAFSRSAPQLDMTHPHNRLKYDAIAAHEAVRTQAGKVWDVTRTCISSSPSRSARSAGITSDDVQSPLSPAKHQLCIPAPEIRQLRPRSALRTAPWMDPHSNLDASNPEYLHSHSQEASLSASGALECHSSRANAESTCVQWHYSSGNTAQDSDAARPGRVCHRGKSVQQPAEIAPVYASSGRGQNASPPDVAAEEERVREVSLNGSTSKAVQQVTYDEQPAQKSTHTPSVFESSKVAPGAQRSVDTSQFYEIATVCGAHIPYATMPTMPTCLMHIPYALHASMIDDHFENSRLMIFLKPGLETLWP
jgi:hypothetical protein